MDWQIVSKPKRRRVLALRVPRKPWASWMGRSQLLRSRQVREILEEEELCQSFAQHLQLPLGQRKGEYTIDAGGPLVFGNRVVHLKLGYWFVLRFHGCLGDWSFVGYKSAGAERLTSTLLLLHGQVFNCVGWQADSP